MTTPKDPLELFKLDIAQGKHEEAKALALALGLSLQTEIELNRFITQDEEMLRLKDDIRKLANQPYPVCIIGETGTGKEILARALHGDRMPSRFRAINCAAMPEHLLESELFGHIKGAFTGAIVDKEGLIASAAEGTMFMDEIGDMKLELQAKMLRVLEDRKIRKVGSTQDIDITNVRFVFATNKDIEHRTLLVEPLFRPDLYYRISAFELKTKPLRERREDIPSILSSLGIGKLAYDFIKDDPDLRGNVRELQNRVLRYQVLGRI